MLRLAGILARSVLASSSLAAFAALSSALQPVELAAARIELLEAVERLRVVHLRALLVSASETVFLVL